MSNDKRVRVSARLALIFGALALMIIIGGDGRIVAQVGTSVGIDPLEVLELQVKPNVIVVLDSSGSMTETVTGVNTNSGDHPRSKMYQAKQVLKQVMAQNANRVTFLFGQYTQDTYNPPGTTVGTRMVTWNNGGTVTNRGSDRFLYTTDNVTSPSMVATELTLQKEPPPANTVNIEAGVNDQIRFLERTDANSSARTYYDCTITAPAGTYTTDADMTTLAASITASMNVASYSPGSCARYAGGGSSTNVPQNSYTVTWNAVSRFFVFSRSAGSDAFQLRLSTGTGGSTLSAAPAMGFVVNIPNVSTPGPTTTNITSTTFADANWCGTPSLACTLNGAAFTSTSSVATRGFQAFQDIRATWNTLYYSETSGSTKNCVVTLTPGFRRTGEELAVDLEIGMNTCTGRFGTPNSYHVTFAPATGAFTFARTAGSNSWTLQWATTTNSIGPALNASTSNVSPGSGTTYTTGSSIRFLRRAASDEFTEGTLTTYHLIAGKYFNGETIRVQADGTLCDVSAPGTPQNPPVLFLQQVSSPCGSDVGAPVTWTFAGGEFGGNTVSCGGFSDKVPLTTCDQTQGQLALITPFLENSINFNANGTLANYLETTDGSFDMPPMATNTGQRPGLTGGLKANGSTPIAKSLTDIKGLFTTLWNSGQASPAVLPLKNHTNPKEQTIVIFVTDGDDTCAAGSSGDDDAKVAAYAAEQLFAPLDATQPAPNPSSVATYMVGFGSGASINRLNWIAWGGSGLGQNQVDEPDVTLSGTGSATQWSSAYTAAQLQSLRNACPGCHDAYIAPDAATLAAVIEGLIDRGASTGTFTAQQSIQASIYEEVSELPGSFQGAPFSPANPNNRYFGVVPQLMRSSFTLPGFWGSLTALTNEVIPATTTHVVFTRWDAGQVMLNSIKYGPGHVLGTSTGMSTCNDDGVANSGNCTFVTLTGNSSFGSAKIQRHIYTSGDNAAGTGRNGVFPVTLSNYFDTNWLRTNGNRLELWPPAPQVAPNQGTTSALYTTTSAGGTLDAALGLSSMTFQQLQDTFGACMGTSAPAACGVAASQYAMALKEARHIVLAYMAGAQLLLDNAGNPRRPASGTFVGQLLFQSRAWALADGTLGAPAEIGPPDQQPPTQLGLDNEYILYRDGPRDSTNTAVLGAGDVGYGLRNPDKDKNAPGLTGPDLRATIKPVMSVVYMPANDMVHAFRAGPSAAITTPPTLTPPTPNCTVSNTRDCGGEELWGYVPFDQLSKIPQLLLPQSHNQAVYVVAAGLRFTDVFVPVTGTTGNYDGATTTVSVGGVSNTVKGVWRRLMLFGRGIAGDYMTALDVTSPGPYTRTVKDTGSSSIIGPVVLWTRGNPDTQDGNCKSGSAGCLAGANSYNNTVNDYDAFLKMGQTWSIPAAVRINRLNTARKPCTGGVLPGGVCANQTVGGVNMVAIMGSGYGATGATPPQGQTLFTLDLLTGDVAQTADVVSRPSPPSYTNAIVAPPVAYIASDFDPNRIGHAMNDVATRVYVGDLHGRVWKFLTPRLDLAIQFADIGANQPIATPFSLLMLPFGNGVPHIYGESGNDTRADSTVTGPFRLFAFRDDQTDTDTSAPTPTITPSTINACITAPQLPCLFARDLVTTFRGTVQPASVYVADPNPLNTGGRLGRVFFGGTRLVPPPPLSTLSTQVGATGGPCRSRFDSIIYALTGEAGAAGYDLNASGQDEYVILNSSRIVGLTEQTSNSTGGYSDLHVDEGMATPTPAPTGGPTPAPTDCTNNCPSRKGTVSTSTSLVSFTQVWRQSRICAQ
jgi:hypothetical protein